MVVDIKTIMDDQAAIAELFTDLQRLQDQVNMLTKNNEKLVNQVIAANKVVDEYTLIVKIFGNPNQEGVLGNYIRDFRYGI